MTTVESAESTVARPRLLAAALLFIALVVAAIGSLGAPLITSVATTFRVPLSSAQWTLTITLLTGAVATPVLGRLGSGPRRRGTVIATLATVTAGSVLTVAPLGFAGLVAGRAAQGTGLGLTALMMGAARDHLRPDRSASAISLISVASTIGIGIGYPLAGLLTQVAGLRAAYAIGVVVGVMALAVAVIAVPAAPAGRTVPADVPGAVLLAGGLLALLIPVSEPGLWAHHAALGTGLLAAAAVLLTGWVLCERRSAAPLVDVTLLRHPAVAGANAAMLVAGMGMYLLLTLITRYVQTPGSAGYGFGASTFVAGLALVPFSALGFAAGKLAPLLGARLGAGRLLAVSAIIVLAACAVFAVARADLAEALVAMAILGCGVGIFSAAMPGVILAVTPASETSSAMGVNQVVRSTGFAIGSALGGFILADATSAGRTFPLNDGYTTAAWAGVAIMGLAAVLALILTLRQAVGGPS
ncbi:MAG: MFS transporter [Streptosporangiaceae bacterium]